MTATTAGEALGFGLFFSAFWFGFRHGIDWDHIAAISDITSSQENRRTSIQFGSLYALGHAVVVFCIGVVAIIVGESLPPSVDETMTQIVGVTLILLGVYVFVSLIRHGRDFRMRSRWMLVFAGVRKGTRWARRKIDATTAREAFSGRAEDELRDEGPGDLSLRHHGHHGRPGHHHHLGEPEPDDQFMNYGRGTAFTVGMLHGVGGETPTQVVIFATAAGVGGGLTGVAVLFAFLVGLFASNTVITLGSAFGYLRASKNWGIYVGVALLTGVFSLVIGTLFLTGKTTMLPALFGG